MSEPAQPNRRAQLLSAVVVVMMLVIVLLAYLFGKADDKPVTAPTPTNPQPSLQMPNGQVTAPSQTPSEAPSEHRSGAEEHEGDDTTTRAQKAVVNQWMKAWLTPGSVEKRTAALKPWGNAQAVQTGALVDASKLPEGPVKTVLMDDSFALTREGLAYVHLADDSKWQVALVQDETSKGGWIVRYIVPGEALD